MYISITFPLTFLPLSTTVYSPEYVPAPLTRIFEPSGRTFGSAATVPLHDFDPSADFPSIEYADAVNFAGPAFRWGVAAARLATKRIAMRNVAGVRHMNILRTAPTEKFLHAGRGIEAAHQVPVARTSTPAPTTAANRSSPQNVFLITLVVWSPSSVSLCRRGLTFRCSRPAAVRWWPGASAPRASGRTRSEHHGYSKRWRLENVPSWSQISRPRSVSDLLSKLASLVIQEGEVASTIFIPACVRVEISGRPTPRWSGPRW